MFGVLEVCPVQLRNEVYFVELSELCSANYRFSQLRTGVPCLTCLIHLLPSSEPSRDSSVVRALDSLSKGHWFESRQKRRQIFIFLLFYFHFGIRSNPVLPQWHVKDPGHFAKSAGGRLRLNTHAPYVCGFAWSDVTRCMVVWCTRNAPRRQQFQVAPVM